MVQAEKNNIKTVTGLGQCSLDQIALVRGYPEEDSKAEAEELITQGGGPVATALIALARLDVPCRFIGAVADDEAGRAIKKEFNAEGVSTKGLITRRGGSSQKAFIIVNTKNASRTIIWQRPGGAPLTSAEVRPGLIKDASLLILDGLMEEASIKATELGNKFAVPILLDAGSMRPGMLRLAAASDLIVASKRFANELAPTPQKAIKELRALNPEARVITITLGEEGSLTCAGKEIFRKGAYAVKAVDTTGAGDVFHGGFAYGILKRWPIKKTIEFASALAALKCLKAGGRTGIPSLKETLRLMKEQDI